MKDKSVKKKVKIIRKLDVKTGVKNPTAFPWDFQDGSMSEIKVANVFEFIPGKQRGRFMDEIYRLLSKDGLATFTVPYYASWVGNFDYRYEWPPFSLQSFLVFDKAWREVNRPDCKLNCDFEFNYVCNEDGNLVGRNDEFKVFAQTFYNNSIMSLQLVFRKKQNVTNSTSK